MKLYILQLKKIKIYQDSNERFEYTIKFKFNNIYIYIYIFIYREREVGDRSWSYAGE